MASTTDNAQTSVPAEDAHLLSYPLKPGDVCVLSSDPEHWGRTTAWDLREHDLERWLDAQHGSTPEEFWTKHFIHFRGKPYCEAVLKAIVMWNHEEVGGHAVMFMDQILMWQPHYFPYAMKYRCNVDELFEPDQITHHGRVFLEKVVEWCKLVYLKNQAYWDAILEKPPSGQRLEQFVAEVKANHYPGKLKEMKIVPEDRPDEWPIVYFARARGKSTLPQGLSVANYQPVDFSTAGNQGVHQDKPADTQPQDSDDKDTTQSSGTGSASGHEESQGTQAAGDNTQSTIRSPVAAGGDGGGGGDDDDDSDSEDKKSGPHQSKAPQPPKGKKPVGKETLKVPESFLHRRVKSESDSPVKEADKPQLSLADWMTAPGLERRAVSTESQSGLLAIVATKNKPNEIPKHGRGGAEQAIGRYEYRPGNPPPVFQHPYDPNFVALNNAAYLYHEDHNFGRHNAPFPDHSTTYRPGSNIYRSDPRRGDMFVPNPNPEPHFNQPRGPHHQVAQPMHYAAQMGSPHATFAGQPGSVMMAPHGPQAPTHPTVATAPFGVVPGNVMEPYILHAMNGVWPTVPPPLSQVGQPPRYPGFQPMRHPPQYIMHGPPQQQAYVPHQQQHYVPAHFQAAAVGSGPHLGIPGGQDLSVRHMANTSAPYGGARGGRRAHTRTDAPHFSPGQPRTPQIRRGVGQSSTYNNPLLNEPPVVLPPRTGRPSRRMSNTSQVAHPSPLVADTVPFPSYAEDAIDMANLTEGQQCEPDFIGPDAEDVDTLWFGNIPLDTTADQLKAFVAITVPVVDVKSPITFDPNMNAGLGWTFVKFNSNADARKALQELHYAEFKDGHLKVQVPERRTREGIERRVRAGSSFGRFNHSQPFGQGSGYTGHQPSFSGGSTPGRYPGPPVVTGPRGSRGSSMSQAIHAVRRNSAFTQQDARSDLPLADLPEDSEPSRTPTPNPPIQMPPEQPAHIDLGESEAPKKPAKKKHKKKKPNRSRDGSTAPSESNKSSAAEGSSSSRDIATSVGKENVKPQLRGSALAFQSQAAVVESEASAGSSYSAAPVEPLESLEPGRIQPVEDAASASIKAPSAVHSEDETTFKQDEDTLEKPAPVGEPVSDDQAMDTQEQEYIPEPSLEPVTVAPEQDNSMSAAEVTEAGDIKPETTTTVPDQPKPGPSKAPKEKGAAQTESLSIYNKKTKSEKDAEKKKAKKQRQASRKVSKGTAAQLGSKNDDKVDEEEDAELDAAVPLPGELPVDGGGLGENKSAKGKGKRAALGASDSSSLVGTPTTAREHFSSPKTPTQKGFLSSLHQGGTVFVKDSDDGEDDEAVFDDGDVTRDSGDGNTGGGGSGTGQQQPERRPSILQGMFQSDPTDPSGKESVDALEQQSAGHSPLPSEPSHDSMVPAPKKKTAKMKDKDSESSSNRTYAQAAKNPKAQDASTTTTTLGLTERDVNVPR